MNKIFFILAVILLPFFSINIQSQSLSPEEIYRSTESSILYIQSFDEEGYMLSHGSGVLVNNGYVYTCFHLYDGSEYMEFELNGKRYSDVVIAGADPEKDIIIFKIKELLAEGIIPGNSDSAVPGQTVYSIGNPRSYKKTFSSGLISAIRKDKVNNGHTQLQFSASISPGSSGGALLNTDGDLIGIAASSDKNGQNLNFAIPVNEFLNIRIINTDDTIQVNAMENYCKGYSYYKNSRYFMANNFLNSSLEYFKNDINVLSVSGINYTQRNMYDSALSRFNDIILINAGDKKVYSDRGWLYYYKSDTANAFNDFNKAIEIDSNYIDGIYGRACMFHYLSHNYDSAIIDFNRILILDPDYNYIYRVRAESYLGKGDTDKAILDLTMSINYDIDDAFTCYNRALIFLEFKEYEYSIMDFTQAIKLDPYNSEYYFSRAIAYIKSFDHVNAISDYNEGIKLNSRDASSFNNLAYSHLALNEYEDAERNFKRCLVIDSRHFDSMLGLSIIHYLQKDKTECLKYIRKAADTESLIKKGMKGIEKLEETGYFWSRSEKEYFNKIFKLAGYYSYEDDNRIHPQKGRRVPVQIK
jgi:tetratricopeptide (TPR) repeat protein